MEGSPHGYVSLGSVEDSGTRHNLENTKHKLSSGRIGGPLTPWDAELRSTRLCRIRLMMSAAPGRELSQEVLIFRGRRKHRLDINSK